MNIKNILAKVLVVISVFLILIALTGYAAGDVTVATSVLVVAIAILIPAIRIIYFQNYLKQINALKSEKEKIEFDIAKFKAAHELDIKKCEKEKTDLINSYDALLSEKADELKVLDEKINNYDKELTIKYVDNRDYSDVTSTQLKNELSMLNLSTNNLIRDNKATVSLSTIDPKRVNILSKQILKNFNSDVDIALSKLTFSNSDAIRARIVRAFENANKLFSSDQISIAKPYLNLRLEELNLLHQYKIKIEDEREQQKAIREQILEEEKVRREIEREKIKIDKEETQFKNEQNKLMLYMAKAKDDIERSLYLDKIKALEEKLHMLEKDKQNVFEREANTRAGYVYVISNIGSFGEDVYKIGMTRRLEPMDRVKELGDASVPFEFDVHAMIFSEDAPKLEAALHQNFRNQAVNKINSRKEFFKVSLKDIETVVRDNHDAVVEFTEIAKAEQYRESLRLANV